MDPEFEQSHAIALQLIGEAAIRERLLRMQIAALTAPPTPPAE